MSSREKILSAIKTNQPDYQKLDVQFKFETVYDDLFNKFSEILSFVGGKAIEVKNFDEIKADIQSHYSGVTRIATTIAEFSDLADFSLNIADPHDLETLNLAIIEGDFAVAENGAIWVSEKHIPHRVLPMITQYLVIVVKKSEIVTNMHRAYERVKVDDTGFGTFISGPSKTADIEQSLVIGAHGARGLTVYVLG
ncbi:L-lactate dehydrogenase complex protein LldG [Arcicella aurantiaca]|uniref:L-lactate dehydrogenase complex protein LldG n=1 Tax=Arcicella aurantiaca TaxID=591202 RepID=A0A316E9R6_9BACT|nr:LUD domain-containing protein [Arcicella aurantiaca]PWK26388.1 L-lactate dehydrogenase complex protein LldG [Arcicella aurantiaca]